jgi:hypothetical protein
MTELYPMEVSFSLTAQSKAVVVVYRRLYDLLVQKRKEKARLLFKPSNLKITHITSAYSFLVEVKTPNLCRRL